MITNSKAAKAPYYYQISAVGDKSMFPGHIDRKGIISDISTAIIDKTTIAIIAKLKIRTIESG